MSNSLKIEKKYLLWEIKSHSGYDSMVRVYLVDGTVFIQEETPDGEPLGRFVRSEFPARIDYQKALEQIYSAGPDDTVSGLKRIAAKALGWGYQPKRVPRVHYDVTYDGPMTEAGADSGGGYGEALCGVEKRAVNDLEWTESHGNEGVTCKTCRRILGLENKKPKAKQLELKGVSDGNQ